MPIPPCPFTGTRPGLRVPVALAVLCLHVGGWAPCRAQSDSGSDSGSGEGLPPAVATCAAAPAALDVRAAGQTGYALIQALCPGVLAGRLFGRARLDAGATPIEQLPRPGSSAPTAYDLDAPPAVGRLTPPNVYVAPAQTEPGHPSAHPLRRWSLPLLVPSAPLRSATAPETAAQARVASLAPAVTEAARRRGVDPLLMHAVAHVESRHNPAAVSPAGAVGLMQVMPATARRFGVEQPEQALLVAQTNLDAAAALLSTLLTRYRGDLPLVLAAYNAGEGAVERYGRSIPPFPETHDYVRRVLAVHARLSEEFRVGTHGRIQRRGEPS